MDRAFSAVLIVPPPDGASAAKPHLVVCERTFNQQFRCLRGAIVLILTDTAAPIGVVPLREALPRGPDTTPRRA